MNSDKNFIIFSILAILALDTIHSASGQYQPIYFLSSDGVYIFGPDVKYNKKTNNYYANAFEEEILAACSQKDNPDSFKITNKEMDTMDIGPSCKQQSKPKIYKMQLASWFIINTVGFAIHTPGIQTPAEYLDAPEEHKVIPLINFEFDFKLGRIMYVMYWLTLGRLLKPELDDEKNREYEKNPYFYDYDVDILYSKANCPFVKVQLAPEEDFFFDSWKLSCRQNALTAPMYQVLLPQWRALEKFIRKVTRVIKSVIIRTGVHGILTQSSADSFSATVGSTEYKYPVPQYFWKKVFIHVLHEHQMHRLGILFVMHNTDPNNTTESNDVPKICPKDEAEIATTGWNFLPYDEFKSPMYGCLMTTENLKHFDQIAGERYKAFDLQHVPMLLDGGEGNVGEQFRIINVLDEMKKLEES